MDTEIKVHFPDGTVQDYDGGQGDLIHSLEEDGLEVVDAWQDADGVDHYEVQEK